MPVIIVFPVMIMPVWTIHILSAGMITGAVITVMMSAVPEVPFIEIYPSAMRDMITVRVIIRLIVQAAPTSVRINKIMNQTGNHIPPQATVMIIWAIQGYPLMPEAFINGNVKASERITVS